jgi:transcriptional regulator with XRE-family HTH domain
MSNHIRPIVIDLAYPAQMSDEQDQAQRVAFGRRLKDARERSLLTQDQIADRFGINKATVSAWETGRGLPDALRLARLAVMYQTTTDALVSDTGPSAEAIAFAAQYEAMPEPQKSAFKAMWSALVQQVQSGEVHSLPAQRKAVNQ